MFSKSLLLATALVLGSVSAQAQLIETVAGQMTVRISDCERNGGSYSCEHSGNPAVAQDFFIDLEGSKHNDGNNTGDYNYILTTENARVWFHVFINKITNSKKPYYIVTLTFYGNSSEAGRGAYPELFPDLEDTSVEVYSLDNLRNLTAVSPLFKLGGQWKQIDFSVGDLRVE